MKNAVMKPQAMNAAMFGMIMPDRNVPNFCTATRAPPDVLLVPTSAFAAILCLPGRGGERCALLRISYGSPAIPVQRNSEGYGRMKVVRFHAPQDVRVEDAPEPSAGPGELVIRVRNCSTCGTDAKIWRSGHPNLSPPRVLGHEVAGEVVEVGEGRRRLVGGGPGPGDRGHPRRHLPGVPATAG